MKKREGRKDEKRVQEGERKKKWLAGWREKEKKKAGVCW
jgi:ribosome modulation factor